MRCEEADHQWLRVQIVHERYHVDRLDKGLVRRHSFEKSDPRVDLRYLEEEMEAKRKIRPMFSSSELMTGEPD
jgi:hypothetical protein